MTEFFGRDPVLGVYATFMIADGIFLLAGVAVLGEEISAHPEGWWIVLGFGIAGVVGGGLIRFFNRW